MTTETTTYKAVLIQPYNRTEPATGKPVINYYFVYVELPEFSSPPVFLPVSYTNGEEEDNGTLLMNYSAGTQQEGSQLYVCPFFKQYLFNEGNSIFLDNADFRLTGTGEPAPPTKTGTIRVDKTISLDDLDKTQQADTEVPRVCVIPGGNDNYCVIVLCKTGSDHEMMMELGTSPSPDTLKFNFVSGSGPTQSPYIAAIGYVLVDDISDYDYVQVGDLSPVPIPDPVLIG